jgi:uncharacterized protein YqcC (DUF446 family)
MAAQMHPEEMYTQAAQLITAIETEMRAAGFWSEEPLPEDALEVKAAFGMDKLTFDEWLQYIFIPRVKTIVAQHEQLPDRSMVAVKAVREYDGVPGADRLLDLLSDFDELINAGR